MGAKGLITTVRRVTFVMQPDGSRLCGQACVAMLLGVSLKQAVKLVGHTNGTSTKQLKQVLRANNLDCADRLTRIRKEVPLLEGTYLLNVRCPPHSWRHWVVLHNGHVYDPSYGTGVYPLLGWPPSIRATSHMWVGKLPEANK